MSNFAEQTNEIEVLRSIYLNEFSETGKCSYSIQITKTIQLFVTLHSQYPSKSPPKYEIFAPELSTDEKTKVHKEFQAIFKKNMGSPILFQWIEKLKEIAFTSQKKRASKSSKNRGKNSSTIELSQMQKFSKVVVHGPRIEDRKSAFQGHACAIENVEDVRNCLDHLMENKKVLQATHNIYAYRIMTKNLLLQDCEDDGENSAGRRLLHLLEVLDLNNVLVVVTRWRGSILLGPDRFKHINSAAKQALVEANFV